MPFSSPYGDCPPCTQPLHEVLLESIDRVVKEDPDRKAFIKAEDEGDFVRYSDLRAQSSSIAEFLHRHNLSRTTVSTLMFSTFKICVLAIGSSMEGCILASMNPMLTDVEVEKMIETSESSVIMTDKENLGRVLRLKEKMKNIKMVIIDGEPGPSGIFTWSEVILTQVDPARPKMAIRPDDIVLLPFSSGTTGKPKAVMLSHTNISTMMKMRQIHRRCLGQQMTRQGQVSGQGSSGVRPAEIKMIAYSIFHQSGLGASFFALMDGATSIVLSRFEETRFLEIIHKYKLSNIATVPSTIVLLAKNKDAADYTSSLRLIISGAAPLGRELCQQVEHKCRLKISQGYGCTELTLSSHLPDLQTFGKPGSSGKLLPGLMAKIVDKYGNEVPLGQSGELCVKGPTVMVGYKNNQAANEETIREEWLFTGDHVRMDEDGDIFILEREKEMLKVNSLQVAPAEIEEELLKNQRILDCAVIGVADDVLGEVPKAFVVRGDDNLTEQEVMNDLKDLAEFKQLRGGVEFIEEVPRNHAGKILRKNLRNL